jgi:hypothetical protein
MVLLLKAALRIQGWGLWRRFDLAADDPVTSQRRLLAELIGRNARTEFGREHAFGAIRTEADYRARVRVQDYDRLLPYIQKIKSGKQGVLTVDPVVRFNVTSGTTGAAKLIPVTSRSQRSSSRLMLQWAARALRDHPSLLDHASLLIASPAVGGRTDGGIPFGSATGLIHRRLPGVLQRALAIPYWIATEKDYDRRYYLIARLALARRVSFIATPNPSTIHRLAEVVKQHQEDLIRSIHDGVLGTLPSVSDSGALDPMRNDLERSMRPDPDRARFLSQTAERCGHLRLGDCWPDLTLLACWLGGTVGYHADKLREHFDTRVPIRDLGFQASEGSFTVPYRDQTAAGILALHNNFYEFLPEADLEREEPSTIPIDELEQGKQYAMLLTTPGGLYRYNINDIVEVEGWYRRTPLLKFARKGRDMANITGEKLHVNHLIEAMNQVRRAHNLLPAPFRVVPNIKECRYSFCLQNWPGVSQEFVRGVFIPALDDALSAANIEYEEKRRSKRLRPPCVYLMREGWEQSDRRRFSATGQPEVQYKWRILVPTAIPEDDEFILAKIDPLEATT